MPPLPSRQQCPYRRLSAEVDFIRSGSAGVNYTVRRHRHTGTLTEETTIVRTGGAIRWHHADRWKVVTTANCTYSLPFECPPIAIWNDTTGSAKTATIEGIWGGGAVPNDDDIWVDVEYLGDAASPQGSFVNDGKANLLATAATQTIKLGNLGRVHHQVQARRDVHGAAKGLDLCARQMRQGIEQRSTSTRWSR